MEIYQIKHFIAAIGLLWARDREGDLKEFIKFAESHSWRYENEQKA